jgi:peptidoglycan/LPS O-acetylase OafA/YrhL
MIANPVKAPNKRYLELDALRGFAAVFVMLFHYTEGKNAPEIFTLGVSGVDLFFLISGFVIFMSINKVASGKEFVINRVARLYPTYCTCVTFTFGVIILLKVIHFNMNHAREVSFTDYLVNLTMFQYYFNIKDIDVPYWTMIIEMLFYLLILALYQLKLLKHIIPIGCAINGLIIINYALFTQGIISNYTSYFPLMNHFALFLGGIIFYKIVTNAVAKLTGYLVVFFCLLTQTIVFKLTGSNPDHISFMQYAGMLVFYFVMFVLFINGKLKFII